MKSPKSPKILTEMNNYCSHSTAVLALWHHEDITLDQPVESFQPTTLDYDADVTNFKHRARTSEQTSPFRFGQYSPLTKCCKSFRTDCEASNYSERYHIAEVEHVLQMSRDFHSPRKLKECAMTKACQHFSNKKYAQHRQLSGVSASLNVKHKLHNLAHVGSHSLTAANQQHCCTDEALPCLSCSCHTTTPKLTSVFSITSSFVLLLALLQPPMVMAADPSSRDFHPSMVLSLPSSDQTLTNRTSKISPGTRDFGNKVKEDEILHHLYRNGRNMTDFRKPSVTFMVELFNDLQSGGTLGYSNRIEPVTDTVRSFSGANSRKSRKRRRTVDFHVPYLPQHETLRAAEIRFLRSPTQKKAFRRFRFRVDVRAQGRVVNKFTFRENAKPQFEYNVFDVTSIVRPWINDHHGNMSLHIRVSRKLRNHLLMPSKGNTSQSTSLIVLYLEDKEFLKNMYASFTQGDEKVTVTEPGSSSTSLKNSLKSRRKRSLGSSVSFSAKTLFSGEAAQVSDPLKRIPRGVRSRRLRNRKSKRGKCKMYEFYVDFTVIGWGEWIIHPKRFNSKFCFGQCPSPIEAKYHPTNHAMLQTLMRMKLPNVAPAPCCVPTKLKAVSMLYVEFDEIVVRSHEDMVVDQCGCR